MEEEKTVLIEGETEDGTNNGFTPKTPIWKSKKFLIITGLCIVAVISIITTVVLIAGNGKSDIEKRLETANRYLLELDYEQAKAEFEKIIKADPKCVEAYIGLAEAYEGLGEPDKAREVLEEGYEKTKSDKIKKILDETEEETSQETTTKEETTEKESSETTEQEKTTEDYTVGVHWKMEGDTLIIYGHGEMSDYWGNQPWDVREIKNIVIENGVTSIGICAFADCEGLTSIEIPDSVMSVGDSAFNSCGSLTSIEIPDSVVSIGDNAFWECRGLTKIQIPSSVTSIGTAAFNSCMNLTSIEIPDSVTSIGDNAFLLCNNLTIFGTAGSFAEIYANENGIPFVVQ